MARQRHEDCDPFGHLHDLRAMRGPTNQAGRRTAPEGADRTPNTVTSGRRQSRCNRRSAVGAAPCARTAANDPPAHRRAQGTGDHGRSDLRCAARARSTGRTAVKFDLPTAKPQGAPGRPCALYPDGSKEGPRWAESPSDRARPIMPRVGKTGSPWRRHDNCMESDQFRQFTRRRPKAAPPKQRSCPPSQPSVSPAPPPVPPCVSACRESSPSSPCLARSVRMPTTSW